MHATIFICDAFVSRAGVCVCVCVGGGGLCFLFVCWGGGGDLFCGLFCNQLSPIKKLAPSCIKLVMLLL